MMEEETSSSVPKVIGVTMKNESDEIEPVDIKNKLTKIFLEKTKVQQKISEKNEENYIPDYVDMESQNSVNGEQIQIDSNKKTTSTFVIDELRKKISQKTGDDSRESQNYVEMFQEENNEEISKTALIKAFKAPSIIYEGNSTQRKPNTSKPEESASFWDKIGTMGRKKRSNNVRNIQDEGKYVINSPGLAVNSSPEEYNLNENEERSIIMPKEFENPKLQELIQTLIEWINHELISQRIIVQDLCEDLYDGQVLQKLYEKLSGEKLDVPEVTQSDEGQKHKLNVVLESFNRILSHKNSNIIKWNVAVIHSKSIVPILFLLVTLVRKFRPEFRIPENVTISVTVIRKTENGQLTHRIVEEVITSDTTKSGKDDFDKLFEAPEELQNLKKSLQAFSNKHLSKLNLELTNFESQFQDGTFLIMLIGLLGNFFVPFYSFFQTPTDINQKIHNVSLAFQLMEDIGMDTPKSRPEDIVNSDMKSTLRILHSLFKKYKS